MDSEKETSLIDEVGSRFDSIFGQEDDHSARENVQDNLTEKLLHSPIKDIKSTVLSMDWEITDQTLISFGQQLDALREVYRESGVLLQFLKILRALGNYIRKQQSEAHPDAFRLLHSIFDRFERISLSEEMPSKDQRDLLETSIKDFNHLKTLVTIQKSETKTIPGPRPEAAGKKVETDEVPTTTPKEADERPTTPYSGMTPHEAFALAVEELKTLIKNEFQILRTELRMWRDGQ